MPEAGEVHALGAAPTGAWAGQAQMLAAWLDGYWQFLAPQAGWRAWGRAERELRIWTGDAWERPAADLDNLAGVGIGTVADATNRLAVKADATLLGHDGAGHQLKLNKAAAGDTASVLFQSGWTGHAEIGLAGDTDLGFKLSGDGTSWTETLRLTGNGRVGIANGSPLARFHVEQADNDTAIYFHASNPSHSSNVFTLNLSRPAHASARFFAAYSGDLTDKEFDLSGDGNGRCDGSWTGGGADYAEYFEWADGNPEGEDRRGIAVVLEGERIRPARDGEEPIGVISGNPSVIGDGDMDRWKGKYLRDAFGTYLWEPHETVDGTGAAVVQQRRRLNPDFDAAAPYVSRAHRPEWDIVGLMGKLRLRQGQPVGARWIRMRAVGDRVEEWLVR